MKTENKILCALAGIVASFSLIPYIRMPKIIQDLSNVLSSLNPFSYIYRMITTMNIQTAIYTLNPGDHIYCQRRFGYSHHGIYAGCGEVWAYQGLDSDDIKVQKMTLVEFSNGDTINRLNYDADFDTNTILTRASSRDAELMYDVFNNNCMHYAYWCRLRSENISTTQNIFKILTERR